MDSLVSVFLPLSLAMIMFTLGIGLTVADFRRVVERGKVFLVGALCQVMLIPVIAYGVIMAFGITGEIAAGIMLLSFCPGGVTTNAVSKFANGDVALSVSLTAVVSLLSIVTSFKCYRISNQIYWKNNELEPNSSKMCFLS